jgi:hypothetical protein
MSLSSYKIGFHLVEANDWFGVKIEARTTHIPVAKKFQVTIRRLSLTGPKRNEVGVVGEK